MAGVLPPEVTYSAVDAETECFPLLSTGLSSELSDYEGQWFRCCLSSSAKSDAFERLLEGWFAQCAPGGFASYLCGKSHRLRFPGRRLNGFIVNVPLAATRRISFVGGGHPAH